MTKPTTLSRKSSGSPRARLGTIRSDRPSRGNEAAAVAQVIGRPLLDWQRYALDVGLEHEQGKWAFNDVGVAVARQNGKTGGVFGIRILTGLLLWGEAVLYSAQNRDLPRESFLEIAEVLETRFPGRLASRPRRANGQETIRMANGGSLRIVAPRPDAPRGHHADLIVLDEVREYRDTHFVAAILPTQNTSPNPQVWYASNAGDPSSIVLNGLRARGLGGDETLAWLEWSADPALSPDDPEGWAQANPSLGVLIDETRIRHLYDTLDGEAFATEVLCQWVDVAGTRAIPAPLWDSAATDTPGRSERRTAPRRLYRRRPRPGRGGNGRRMASRRRTDRNRPRLIPNRRPRRVNRRRRPTYRRDTPYRCRLRPLDYRSPSRNSHRAGGCRVDACNRPYMGRRLSNIVRTANDRPATTPGTFRPIRTTRLCGTPRIDRRALVDNPRGRTDPGRNRYRPRRTSRRPTPPRLQHLLELSVRTSTLVGALVSCLAPPQHDEAPRYHIGGGLVGTCDALNGQP